MLHSALPLALRLVVPALVHADIRHDDDDLASRAPGLPVHRMHCLKGQVLPRDVGRRKLVRRPAVRTGPEVRCHFAQSTTGQCVVKRAAVPSRQGADLTRLR